MSDTTPQIPARRPTGPSNKTKYGIIGATALVVGSLISFVTVKDTSDTIKNASTTVAESTTLPQSVEYQIGSAGTLLLNSNNDVLSVASAIPAEGWLLKSIEQTATNTVTVTFATMGGNVVFLATVANGNISTSVSATYKETVTTKVYYPVTTQKPTGTTVKPTGTTETTVKSTSTTVRPTTTIPGPTTTTTSTTTTVRQREPRDD